MIARLALTLLAVTVVTACGGEGDTSRLSASPTGAAGSASPSASAAASPVATSTLPPGVDQLVTITYANGKVTTASRRVKVERGDTVQLLVRSDKADEVHLHGYDKKVDVKPGAPARLTFEATIRGVFEVELEERGTLLVRLQVQ